MKNRTTRFQGMSGEQQALRHLLRTGCVCLEKNYRHKRAEIDLIVQDGKVLVFVEVKYRSSTRFGTPETFVSECQKELIRAAAESYIAEKDYKGEIRFDIVALYSRGKKVEFLHVKDAF